MNSNELSKLSELALQYGPFFFALLFVLVVTRWAYGAFKETNHDANKNKQAVSTVRLVFLCSFFFGLLLVVASVGYWFRSRAQIYVFRGEIVDLHDYEKLAPGSDKLYFRREIKDPIDDIPMRNEHFMIVQDAPFHAGDAFDVEFSKNNSTRNKFHIAYDGQDSYPKFRIDWDDNLHTNVLREEKQAPERASLFSWIVYAAQGRAQISVYQAKPRRTTNAPNLNSAVATLQDPSSDVGSKIVALDQLNDMPASVLTDPTPTGGEPAVATLLDLTRHSDKEVSYKAGVVLHKVDLEQYVLQKLNSRQQRDQAYGEKVLFKMNEADSARILQKLPPTKAAALRPRTAQSNSYQVVPTASPQGDRYYVKARWNPGDANTVDCLTSLFNRELMTNRTLDQEKALMKNRSERLVYGFDKDWSSGIAEKIKGCGGEATFVQAGGGR